MSNFSDPLPPDVKRLVLNKLPSILTWPNELVQQLIVCAPHLCVQLAEAFEEVTRQRSAASADSLMPGSREWLHHTMASVPLRNVSLYEDGAMSIEPTADASLRYLLLHHMPDHRAVTDKGVLNRELLCQALFQQVSDSSKKHYAQIAAWRADIGLSDEYSIQGDVAIAKYIHEVEAMYFFKYAAIEADVRKELGLPDNQPTPVHFIGRIASGARVLTLERLNGYIADVASDGKNPDDGVIIVLAHIAANRVLLESAYRDELTKVAAPAIVKLLSAMNAAGIDQIPDLGNDTEVETWLKAWFGKGGQVCADAGWPAMSESDIDVLLDQATQAQAMYRRTRGVIYVATVPDAFNAPADRLCFALALVACWHFKVKVREELVGQARSEYRVLPQRDHQRRDDPLSPNALEMVMTLFGQITMSNTGLNLRATEVEAYAKATSMRRGHLQALVFSVFKEWTPPQLLALQLAIDREEDAREFERAKRRGVHEALMS